MTAKSAPPATRATGDGSPRAYREIFAHSTDAITILGPDGRYIEQNAAHERLTGYGDDELKGMTPAIPLGEETAARIAAHLAQHGQFRGEVACLTKDGRELIIDLSTFTVRDGAGQVVCHVGISRDVTAARHAVAELERSRRNLTDFVETSAIGLHWVGPDGIILWANPADYAPLGYTRDEWISHHIAEFHADPAVIGDILARLTRNERLHSYPARLRAKDGSIRHVLIDSSVLFEHGEFIHTRCFTRDITEERRAKDELELARTQLAASEKLSALGTLVSGVGHEIRTPLTYIANNIALADLELVRGAPPNVERVRRHLGAANEGVDRVNELVRDLRRFTQLRSETEMLAPLDSVVNEAVELFRATHRGLTLLTATLDPVPPMRMCKLEIQQLTLNLLLNAAQAAPHGHVHVATRATADGALIMVEDDGPGVPSDVQLRMFDPFYTTKADGTGLGLSIAKRVVGAHGGTLACESTPGSGARFIAQLPRRD